MFRCACASIFVGLAIAACGSDDAKDESVKVTSYDQTCTRDDDCLLVAELTKTDGRCSMSCPRGPINKVDQERFDADLADARRSCTQIAQPTCIAPETGPTCAASKCTAPPAPTKG